MTSGTLIAAVACGDIVTLLTANHSTYVPPSQWLRLGSPGAISLENIEVQSGSDLAHAYIVYV
jgi:mannose-6-phosphate isomerase-like protein (cupin superfamily)